MWMNVKDVSPKERRHIIGTKEEDFKMSNHTWKDAWRLAMSDRGLTVSRISQCIVYKVRSKNHNGCSHVVWIWPALTAREKFSQSRTNNGLFADVIVQTGDEMTSHTGDVWEFITTKKFGRSPPMKRSFVVFPGIHEDQYYLTLFPKVTQLQESTFAKFWKPNFFLNLWRNGLLWRMVKLSCIWTMHLPGLVTFLKD